MLSETIHFTCITDRLADRKHSINMLSLRKKCVQETKHSIDGKMWNKTLVYLNRTVSSPHKVVQIATTIGFVLFSL